MKQLLYALMAFCAFGLLSCRKNSDNFTIKEFDADQIKTYIKQNNLTGMNPVLSGGDTTGIYYQIITQGNGKVIDYPDKISFVYSFKTFDGNFSSTDTILNHTYNFTAYIAPNGLQLALKNIVKTKGSKVRLLIPSRLAYGINGTTISRYTSENTTSTGIISGNQCLDFTVNLLDDDVTKQAAYDDLSIKKYISANGLSGYIPITTGTYAGVYYKIQQAGTGTDLIDVNSNIGVQYTGTLLNGAIFDEANNNDGTAATTLTLLDGLTAWQGVLPMVTAGAKISILSPSALAYGTAAVSKGSFSIPAFSCVRYDFNIITVTN
ncbi:FKBP-type peptidyl-prolyl cis-trans isomerase [Mucilaginibacter paludis]|uniref:Peptidyl-prolyl cis-trans isomerase n=1 Tax=Mucilaginibacter paludis DSM 18603 TaxID=714943 RepID=H1YGQ5_9SPHI|nr:FKBP-type peptidyl-prolyl cis-trans isomerase [Mucilaginibacter paludis]EHQ26334.1 peptidylprolyl isomerase FKBP-type [Mucilaginibacter paludis DSM 18603]